MNKSFEVSGLSVLLFRVCLSGIFITAGIAHLIHPDQVASRIQSAAFHSFASFFGDPHLLVILTGFALFVGGIALLLGIFTRWAAVLLFLVLIPITITIQMGNGLLHGPLWKNIALFGGLLFFILNNPKVYSLFNLKIFKTMKLNLIAMLVLMTLGTVNLNAQTVESIQKTEQSIRKNGKYALLVMKAQHLKAAIQTGIELKTQNPGIDFQILSCGELVKEISLDQELQSLVKKAVNQHGLKILVCGLSITQFKVDKSLLPIETPTTENGLIYMFGLQEQGYMTIIL